jgi:hypothetical protein
MHETGHRTQGTKHSIVSVASYSTHGNLGADAG